MRKHVKGIPASPGIAIGPAWIYEPFELKYEVRGSCDPEDEISRLDDALAQTETQLEELRARTARTIGEEEAEIFEAHKLFLCDPEFIGSIQTEIRDRRINAEAAVEEGAEKFAQTLLALESEYFQARAQDIRDVGRRLVACLMDVALDDLKLPDHPVIIFADDLTPSDTVQFDKEIILGLCTIRGGPTSHTAILARSLGVPACVSMSFKIQDLENELVCVLNGVEGTLIIDPHETEVAEARNLKSEFMAEWEFRLSSAQEPAVTLDGFSVEVVANIGSLEGARQAVEFGAEGVGLFRTEFLFLDRDTMPTEEEQITVYRKIFEVMETRPVVVRTLDIGGDKNVSYIGFSQEQNPFLGWRAIRMIDKRPDLLSTQLRALLQAGEKTDLRIMIPFVSCLEEVEQALDILNAVKKDLQCEGKPFAQQLQFGIMVEVPSAAILAEDIAHKVDFFSIGTNDLAQYTLAVDRTNEMVAHLASPFHPAVIRLIDQTIKSAHRKGKWVGLCGEMAGDPLAAPLLLGLGLDEFSMAASSVPGVKYVLRKLDRRKCEQIAAEALTLSTTAEVKSYLSNL